MYIDPLIIILYLASLLVLGGALLYLYYHYVKNQAPKYKSKDDKNISKNILNIQSNLKQDINRSISEAKNVLIETEDARRKRLEDLENSITQIEQNSAKLIQDKGALFEKEYQDILNEIRQEAEKSKKSLSDGQYLKQDVAKQIEETLKKVGEHAVYFLQQESVEFEKQYKDVLTNVRDEYLKKAEGTLKSLEKIPDDELNEFKKILEKETVESQTLISKRLNEQYDKIHQELEAYKQEKLKETDKQINRIILKVTEEVVGRSLTIADHQDLVLDALERAKKEGVFD